ncbi:hypothetical protein BN975_00145 [Mycolicibacterium farcinogenes]|nr:hypothetical protein BN975_00145 [Mycolicibacterium farcinogenes]
MAGNRSCNAPRRIMASTGVDAGCAHLHEYLARGRSGPRHIAHLQYVYAAVFIELHNFAPVPYDRSPGRNIPPCHISLSAMWGIDLPIGKLIREQTEA